MSEGYKQCVTYFFVAGGEEWEIRIEDDTTVVLAETRKNGQEDTHMTGEAILIDGVWVLEDSFRQQVATYARDHTADAIEAHLNKYGPPPRKR